jgi:hypothetical protein
MVEIDPFFKGPDAVEAGRDKEFFTDKQEGAVLLGSEMANRLAGTLAVIEGGEDVTSRFTAIKDGVLATADTSPLDRFKEKYFIESNELTTQAVATYLADGSKTSKDKADFVDTVARNQNELLGTPDINRAFIDSQATGAITRTIQDKVSQNVLISNIEEINEANRKGQEIFSQINEEIVLKDFGTIADAAEMLLIPGFGFRMNNVLNESMPGLSAELAASTGFDIGSIHIPGVTDLSAGFLPGEMLTLWKEKMRTGTPSFRVQVAGRMQSALKKHTGFLQDENELEAWTTLMDTLGNLNPTDDEVQLDRWLNNVAGVADLVFLGGLIDGTRQLISKVRAGSAARMLADTNPTAARNFFTEAITDGTEQLAKAAGTTRNDILQTYSLPKPVGAKVNSGPDIAPEVVDKGHEIFDNVSHSSLNFYDTEVQAAADRTIRQLEELAEATPNVHLSKSIISSGEDGGYKARVAIGASADRGFTTAGEARDVAEGFMEVANGASFEIRKRDYASSELVPMVKGENELEQGEYFVLIDQEVVPTKLDVGGHQLGTVTGVSGGVAKYFDPNGRLAAFITNAAVRAVDKEASVRTQFAAVVRNFSNLGARKQSHVLYALEESSQQRRWMELDELLERFDGDTRIVKGYIAVRSHEDLLWVVNNDRLRKELIDNNWFHLSSQDFDTFATAMTKQSAENNIRAYYDPVQKLVIETDPASIGQMYEEGLAFGRMRGDQQVGNHRTEFVLIDKNKGTSLNRIPEHVMRYIPGYITVIHDTSHLIKKRLTGIKRNGELIAGNLAEGLEKGEMLQTFRTAANKAEANRAARAFNLNAEPGVRYVVVEAKEVRDVRYADQLDLDSMRDSGRLFFSRRSPTVKSVTGQNVLVNIQDSMKRAASATARHLAFDEFSAAFRTRWENDYKQFSTTGAFPANPKAMKERPAAIDEQSDYDDAVALADYINIVEGADNSFTSAMTKKSLLWVANYITGEGLGPYSRMQRLKEGTAEFLLARAKKPDFLVNVPKSVAFIQFLAFSPIRQLWMQASQATIYAGVDHGFKYMVRPGKEGLAWQGSALATGLLSLDHPKVWQKVAPTAAKALDMTVPEYKEFILNFRRSGLNNISSNEYASIMTLDPRTVVATGGNKMVERILQLGATGVRGASALTRFARDIGFGLGEMMNIQTSYLVAMNRFLKNNPKQTLRTIQFNKDTIDLIAADARQLSFNMARAGNTAQSKGALSLLLQFTSHQQKALQIMLPTAVAGKAIPGISKIANKRFNQREKNRILFNNVILYGASGVGLAGLYEAARDEAGIVVPDEVDDLIRGGLQDLLLNAALNLATDSDGDISFSRTMAPLSGAPAGNPASKIFDILMDSNGSILDVIPGVSAISNVTEAIEMVLDIYSVRPLPQGKKFLLAFDEFSRLLPQYNNFMKALFAFRTGQMASSSGSPIANVQLTEIIARGLVGTPSEKEIQINDILYSGKHFNKGPLDEEQEIREIARQSYKFHKTLSFRLGLGEIDKDEVRRLMTNDGYLLQHSLDPTRLEAVNRAKWELYLNDQDENGENKLTELYDRLLTKGFIDTADPLLTQIKNTEEFEGKAELLGLVQDMIDLKNELDEEGGN